MSLPPDLAAAMARLMDGVSRKDLAGRVEKLSAIYRAGGTSAGIAEAADALAYLAARLPATFAATRAAMARAAQVAPDFAPRSLIDMGAGPGTAAHAAADVWPSLTDFRLIDGNARMRALARQLAAGRLSDARIEAGDIAATQGEADLVTAAYLFAELPEGAAAAAALRLWRMARGMLILVEPGTPAGFARLRAARAALIEAGAHVLAPCTHDRACPMAGADWCHFSERLPRSRDHMQTKRASVPFEDERYAYLAVTREPLASGARILRPPAESKPGFAFTLCDADGLRQAFVARRDRDAFRRVRRLGWGDVF